VQRLLSFAPDFGRDLGDLAVGHVGQPGEDVFQISIRVEVAPPTAFDDGINDGAAFTGIRIPDKEPVLLADGGGADGVFYAETPIMPRTRRGG